MDPLDTRRLQRRQESASSHNRPGSWAVRLEFPILSLHPGLRHRCVAPGVWPPGATDAVRVQGTHLIPPPPERQLRSPSSNSAPRLTPRLRRHRAMAARAPRRCRAPRHPLMPVPPVRHPAPRAAGQPSRHGITARPAASVALAPRFRGPHRRTWPSPPGRSRRSGAPAVVKRVDRDTARLPATSPVRTR